MNTHHASTWAKVAFVGLLGSVAISAQAQYVVVPNAYANVAASGSGLNTFIRDLNAPRTGQLLINANQLGSVNVGDQITGISFRLWTGSTANFPPNGATWAQYDIEVGQALADPLQWNTTFANNYVGTPTLVRTGPLTVPANAYIGTGGSPRPWGTEITFTTPYVYTGGNLAITIRHGGSDIVNVASDFLEVATTTDALYTSNAIRSYTATSNTATVGTQANFTVSRLTVSAVPEPATMSLLGLGAVALLARRRRSV